MNDNINILILKLQNNINNFVKVNSSSDVDLENLIMMNYDEETDKTDIHVRHCISEDDFLIISFDSLLQDFSYETRCFMSENYSLYNMLENYFYRVRNIFMQRDVESVTYKIRADENNSIEDNHSSYDLTEHASPFSHIHYDNEFLQITSEVLFLNLKYQMLFNPFYNEYERMPIENHSDYFVAQVYIMIIIIYIILKP